MIRKSTILLLVALLLGSCDSMQKDRLAWHKKPLVMAKPESAGFSSERLQRIDTMFRTFVDQHKIAGVTALVARRGKIVYYKATGFDDMEKRTPLQKDAIFRIASQTKAITSVAVMMLYEEGRISLNDPVSLYLPEFGDPRIVTGFNKKDSSYTSRPAKRPVTIHDLLTHTSGYCYPGNGGDEVNAIYVKNKVVNGVPSHISTLKEEMQKIATVPLVHEPGEMFTYGLSTDILGYLVETVSGQSLDNFFRTRIFVPLGMTDTYFRLPKEKEGRLMLLYEDGNRGNGIVKSTGEYKDYPMREGVYYSGGGGLSSTAMDYAIFEQMLLNEGEYNGIRLLGRKTIQMMRTNQIGDLGAGSIFLPGSTDKFGLGFEVISLPGSVGVPISQGAFGWAGAFGSLYWIDPGEDLIAILVIQKLGNYSDIRNKFIATVYQAIEEVKNDE
jgi:CubicO group peptidase (beta-lactamase class C family)